jgi:hypothetical protein
MAARLRRHCLSASTVLSGLTAATAPTRAIRADREQGFEPFVAGVAWARLPAGSSSPLPRAGACRGLGPDHYARLAAVSPAPAGARRRAPDCEGSGSEEAARRRRGFEALRRGCFSAREPSGSKNRAGAPGSRVPRWRGDGAGGRAERGIVPALATGSTAFQTVVEKSGLPTDVGRNQTSSISAPEFAPQAIGNASARFLAAHC